MQKNENAEPTIFLKGATLYDDWEDLKVKRRVYKEALKKYKYRKA